MFFVLIFGTASIVTFNSYRRATNYAIHLNEIRANLLAKLILEHQRAAIGILRSYGSRTLLMDSVQRKDLKETVRHLTDLLKNNPEMEWPFISNPDSTIWANFPVDGKVMNKDLSYRDWYKGVSKEWKPYISSAYKMIVGKEDIAVAISVPIFDGKGKVTGILSTAQSTAFFRKIISEVGLDLDTKVTLIDQEGHIIYSNRFPYRKEVISYPYSEFVGKVMKGEKGDVEIRDSSDEDRIKYVSFAPIEGIGWSVIIEKSKSKVLKSEFTSFLQTGIVSLLAMVVALCLAYLSEKHRQVVALRTLSAERAIANERLMGEIAERKRAEEEREKLIRQLQKALAEVKTLKGIFPICASCKKVRDDKGYWTQIEAYIRDHSEAEFSHGICPECMKKLYPDLAGDE